MSGDSISAGVFGVGLETYWTQFEGLLDRLNGYQNKIINQMEQLDVNVVNAGMVDTPKKSILAAELFQQKGVDLIFLYISTYSLSSTVLPLVQRVKTPVVILNMQPTEVIDYNHINSLKDRGDMTGEWLANCQACSVPEIAYVFSRAGITINLVTGFLDDEIAWREINEWIDAARVSRVMRDNRMGLLGHYYGGMLDVYTDLTEQSAVFGTHIEMLEMCELRGIRDEVTEEDSRIKLAEFADAFDVSPDCSRYELERAARTSVALDRLVERHHLGSMAYYYEGAAGNEYENIVTSIIAGNSLLTARHIPVAGEYEVKNVQAMKIMDAFNAGGSFSEFYGMDFKNDLLLLGHDGPAHFAIAEGRVGLVPLPMYHGKPGQGLSIQMSVKHGPITMLSVVQDSQGKTFLLVAEGECVEGPILRIGNTNSQYRFSLNPRDFMTKWAEAGPAHHFAIGTGHIAERLTKLARILDIECRVIC